MSLLTASEKNEYAEKHKNLAYYTANMFQGSKIDLSDLHGIAFVGFTQALNTYDKGKGIRFSTYAVTCMRNEILHFIRRNKKHNKTRLLGDSIAEDKDGNNLLVGDIISDEESISLENSLLLKEDFNTIKDAIKRLNKREQLIIIYRFGLNGQKPLTQSAVGKMLGTSQANISRLENEILKELAFYLKGRIEVEGNDFYHDLQTDEETSFQEEEVLENYIQERKSRKRKTRNRKTS